MICRCDHPHVYRDRLHGEIRCERCGGDPREDLGGPDDLARLRYRIRLNHLREIGQPKKRKWKGREARVLKARYMRSEGFNYAQIAEALDVTESTVQLYLHPTKYERHKTRQRNRAKANYPSRLEYQRKYQAANREAINEYQRNYKRRKRAEARAQA